MTRIKTNKVQYPTDRQINSTENNGYAEGYRDENLVSKDLLDTEISEDDMLPKAVRENDEAIRDTYNEEGFKFSDE